MALKFLMVLATLSLHQLVAGFSISLNSGNTLCAKAVGSNVPKVTCVTSEAAQQWTQNANGEVTNTATGTCLTADYTLFGTVSVPVTLAPCVGDATQRWDFTTTGIVLRSPATCGILNNPCVWVYLNATTPRLIDSFGGGDPFALLNVRFQTVLGGLLKTVSFNTPALGSQTALKTTGTSTRFFFDIYRALCDNANRDDTCLLTSGKMRKFSPSNINNVGVGLWSIRDSNIVLEYVRCPNGGCPPSGSFDGLGMTYDSGLAQFTVCNTTATGCAFTQFSLI